MAEALLVKSGGGTDSGDLTATLSQVLSGYTAMTSDSNDDVGTGTMPNRGAVNQSLNAGGSYTIPQGYHNGSGRVTANSLASQTSANAGAAQILSGYNAWINGNKVSGTMTNRGTVNQSLNAGGSYTIPQGYHNGSGRVTANSLASQTDGTAGAGQILSGYTAWVDGSKVTGNMANRGTLNFNPSSSTSQSVSAGYYSGGTLSSANAYNAGYAAVSLYNISSSFSEPVYVDSPSQAHRVTALSDLTAYKYIILSFGYQNVGMSLNGEIYITNCTQVNYSVAGDLGVVVLQNVGNGATIDFGHVGTGQGNRIAWGMR